MRTVILLLSMALAGCGASRAIDATQEMPGKMDQMQAQMDEMKRKLTEALTFEAMLKPEYGHDLLPVPFDLMPFAKQIAENADPDNVPELFYLWVKKLNEVTIDAGPVRETPESFNHRKLQTLMALQAVAGFLPRPQLQVILDRQVMRAGRYQTSALQLLMFRVQFLRDILLEADLFAEPMDTVGKLEKAVQYADEIEFVSRLPYVREIGVKITAFVDPYPVMEERLDVAVAPSMWRKLKLKAERGLEVQPKSWSDNPAVDEKLRSERATRYQSAITVVDARLRGWGKVP